MQNLIMYKVWSLVWTQKADSESPLMCCVSGLICEARRENQERFCDATGS